jgi:DNA-binding response OmpR family regulator
MLTARGYILDKDDVARTNIREVISKPFSARDVLARATAILSKAAPGESPLAEAA